MRVGLFDSGIGGLTVLKTLTMKYPNNDYIYFGDTKNLPYGSKNKSELKKLAKKNIDFLLKFDVDIIIIACGTVSSNCLDYLKSEYSIKIIDVISPTINYLNSTNYNNILIMATEATINSHIFKNNITKNIFELATPKLVPLIEERKFDSIDKELNNYLCEYKDKIDLLVLGCTHYPLLVKRINKILDINILDMSSLIMLNNSGSGSIQIYFSSVDKVLCDNVKYILKKDITIHEVNI